MAFLPLILLCSCASAPKMPELDLSQPGWFKQTGQAVWKPSASRPELAGNLLLATNLDGGMFLQFSKEPFPVATAQVQDGLWRIDFGVNTFSFGGKGTPSTRFSWFELASVLGGSKPDSGWRFETATNDHSWKLRNIHTGELIRGFLEQ